MYFSVGSGGPGYFCRVRRVRRELKEEADELGIDLRSVLEKVIESEARRVKRERLKRLFEEALGAIDFTVEDWVRAVRESRDER